MVKIRFKKFVALVLVFVTIFSAVPSFAYNSKGNDGISTKTIYQEYDYLSSNFSEFRKDLLSQNFDYTGLCDFSNSRTRSVGSVAFKTAMKFLKNNWPKVVKVARKYGIKLAAGKIVSSAIDDLLDGVVDVDENIDYAIYYVVDVAAPSSFSFQAKKILANGIRLLLPI